MNFDVAAVVVGFVIIAGVCFQKALPSVFKSVIGLVEYPHEGTSSSSHSSSGYSGGGGANEPKDEYVYAGLFGGRGPLAMFKENQGMPVATELVSYFGAIGFLPKVD